MSDKEKKDEKAEKGRANGREKGSSEFESVEVSGVSPETMSALKAWEEKLRQSFDLSEKKQKNPKFEEKEALRRRKEQEAFEKAERKRLAQGKLTMFERFEQLSFEELEQLLIAAKTREERSFYRSLLNLKLQIEQEKVIGEVLL